MAMVRFPDGNIHELPDPETEGNNSSVDGIKRQSKLTGSNLLQGLASFPALVMDIGNISPDKSRLSKTKQDQPFGYHMSGVRGGAEALFGVKPETKGEKLAAILIQAGASGLVGPGAIAAPLRSVIAAVGGAVGSELAGRISDTTLARLLGALIGGSVTGMGVNKVAGLSPRIANLAQQADEGLTPAMLSKAQVFQAASAKQGVNIDLAQALEATGVPESNLTKIRDVLANSKTGDVLQKTLRNQPEQLTSLATSTITNLPGELKTPIGAAGDLSKAAAATISAKDAARTAKWKDVFNRTAAAMKANGVADADTITPAAIDNVKQSLEYAASKYPNGPRAAALLSLRDSLYHGDGAPISNPEAINESFKVALNKLDIPDLATSGLDRGSVKWIAARIDDAREQLGNASLPFRAADARYKVFTDRINNPIRASVVGRIATKTGPKEYLESPSAKMTALFSAGTDPALAEGKSDILTLAKRLRKADPTAFPNAAKTYYSGQLAAALEPEINNAKSTAGEVAQRIWTNFFSTSNKMQGLRDTAAGIADSYSLPREEVVKGLENLAQITKAVKSRPGSIGGLASSEITDIAKSNYVSAGARMLGILPFGGFAKTVDQKMLKATFGKFDEILTSPEGAKMLVKLGKVKPLSTEALVILSGYTGAIPNIMPDNN